MECRKADKRSSSKGYYRRNRQEVLKRNAAYDRAHPESARNRQKRLEEKKPGYYKRAGRSWHLKNTYGLSIDDYEQMLLAQGGRCAVCGSREPGGHDTYFSVDHCHNTGKVRALLCNGCNTGIGQLKDDPELLERAAAYLRQHAPANDNASEAA